MSTRTKSWCCVLLIMCIGGFRDARLQTVRVSTPLVAAAQGDVQLPPSRAHETTRARRTVKSDPKPSKPLRAYTKAEVRALIRRHANKHGLDPELPLAIAECESGFRWDAANRSSSARGVFQYLSGTWRATPEGRRGTSVLDTEAHVRTAVAEIAKVGTRAWNASRHCWETVTAPTATHTDLPDLNAL